MLIVYTTKHADAEDVAVRVTRVEQRCDSDSTQKGMELKIVLLYQKKSIKKLDASG
jgi:hypothetical protein